MAGRSSKKAQATQKPKTFDEFDDDDEGFEDDGPELNIEELPRSLRSRDWRDVEKLRELRDLKKLVGDDDFDALFDSDFTGIAAPKVGKKKRK